MNSDNVFSRLENLSGRLNASSDTINETIKTVEKYLASLRLGIKAWVSEPLDTDSAYHDDGEKAGDIEIWFGYTKIAGIWCLAITTDCEWDPHLDKLTPLTQAPRWIRTRALKKLPDLYKVLEEGAQRALKDIEQARDIVGQIETKLPK